MALIREGPTLGSANILEIGCNVGRNLNALFSAGYASLSGIEINTEAVRLFRDTFPEVARVATVYNTPVEEVIRSLQEDAYDVVFSMAVLEHLPPASEWVFAEMARITKGRVITIEDERGRSWRHFPRNYKKVFEAVGLVQIKETDCSGVEGLGPNFVARFFRKPPHIGVENPKPT